jgi:bifunctional DNA-binding transcriptional regulator/antitoxin component of YhaV-PrlF toxin-antitoxin module
VKIPSEIAAKFNIRDGQPINVKILVNGTDVYKGPLTVTSGQELYIPKNVRNLLKNEKEFILTIVR